MLKKKFSKCLALTLACCSILGGTQAFANNIASATPEELYNNGRGIYETGANFTSIGNNVTKRTKFIDQHTDSIAALKITGWNNKAGKLTIWTEDANGKRNSSKNSNVTGTGTWSVAYDSAPTGKQVRLAVQNPLLRTSNPESRAITITGMFYS